MSPNKPEPELIYIRLFYFYVSVFRHTPFSSTNIGNTKGMGVGKYSELSRAQTELLLFLPYILSVWTYHKLAGNLELLLSAVYFLFPHEFPSLFSKSIPSPLSYGSFAIRFCLPWLSHPFLITLLDVINQSINRFGFINVHLLHTDNGSARL